MGNIKDYDLSQIPEVVIDPRSEKFIVAKVGLGDKSKIVVRALEAREHCAVFGLLEQEAVRAGIDDRLVSCLGGGYIDICQWTDRQPEIIISGRSYEFGHEPDRLMTVEMIQRSFPDFKVIWK